MSFHHPSPELLKQFAQAELNGPRASVVSAHIERCSNCKESFRGLERDLSADAFNTANPLSSLEADEAWQKISSRLGPLRAPRLVSESQIEILIDGARFELPRGLRKSASKPIHWTRLGKGGKICKLGVENGNSLFLIYLTSNEEVPLHSHEGAEHSYVISGSYSTDGVQFKTGDFSTSAENVIHAPKAGNEEGCLLLSAVEHRLNFLQGWLSPLNGMIWWILNLRLK